MALIWNAVVATPLKRLSIGIGLLPSDEETKCEDDLNKCSTDKEVLPSAFVCANVAETAEDQASNDTTAHSATTELPAKKAARKAANSKKANTQKSKESFAVNLKAKSAPKATAAKKAAPVSKATKGKSASSSSSSSSSDASGYNARLKVKQERLRTSNRKKHRVG
jgi:hypothetical protein